MINTEKQVDVVAVQWLTVTPAQARVFLDANGANRNVRQAVVDKYSRDMTSGSWMETGEAIKFSESGRLLDGQHRLLACIKSGKSFKSLVVYGLANQAQDAMDSGAKRDAGDTLAINGYKNSKLMAAIANSLMDLRDGSRRNMQRSKAEIMDFVAMHPRLEDTTSACSHLNGYVQRSILGTIHYVGTVFLSEHDAVKSFLATVHTGHASRGLGDPAFCLRERVIATAKSGARTRLSRDAMRNATFHAWNLYRSNKSIKKFIIPEHCSIDGIKPSHWLNAR